MTQAAIKQVALNLSAATTELVIRILAQFPQAQIRSRSIPLSESIRKLSVSLRGLFSIVECRLGHRLQALEH